MTQGDSTFECGENSTRCASDTCPQREASHADPISTRHHRAPPDSASQNTEERGVVLLAVARNRQMALGSLNFGLGFSSARVSNWSADQPRRRAARTFFGVEKKSLPGGGRPAPRDPESRFDARARHAAGAVRGPRRQRGELAERKQRLTPRQDILRPQGRA